MPIGSSLPQTPYFIRALWEWCEDAGLSAQILIHVDDYVRVPRAFVADDRIVLNVGSEATNRLELGNEWITFQARFGSKVEEIEIPIGNVMAIFAEETNQGMAFDLKLLSIAQASTDETENAAGEEPNQEEVKSPEKTSPLKIVK